MPASDGISDATSSSADVFAPKGTLHCFFPTIVADNSSRQFARKPLDSPAPPPRHKPLIAGRTNPPTVVAKPGAADADRMRRLRPRSVAVVHPLRPTRQLVAALGFRTPRDQALTVEDLWQKAGPPHVDVLDDDHKCTICLQLRSHPVFYTCGHGHCYTCIRVWLEEQWECPECRSIIAVPPFKVYAQDALMTRVYGAWDTSVVDYDWSGLTFPVIPVTYT